MEASTHSNSGPNVIEVSDDIFLGKSQRQCCQSLVSSIDGSLQVFATRYHQPFMFKKDMRVVNHAYII